MKKLLIGSVVILIIVGAFWWGYQQAFAPTPSHLPEGQLSDSSSTDDHGDNQTISVIATNLSVPWEIVWLPDTSTLVTERTGTLLHTDIDGEERRLPVPNVSARGEGGLLGMALHPEYEENNWLYIYRTYDDGGVYNEVVRYRYDQASHTLHEEATIISTIPGARYHDGGRIHFGPDGYLYITTGDAGVPDLAQNRDSLAGKLLRVTDTGAIPADNPFGTAIYSYGHRNAQGIAWDSTGQLWSTEHGRSGLQSGMDELNQITPGDNHGWPVIEGDETAAGMQTPVIHSGPDETWAPGSLVAVGDTLFFGGLRGQRLYRADIQTDNTVVLQTYLAEEYGRIRTVAVGPDNALYLLTSNTDGRGNPTAEDDRIIRIPLSTIIN